MKNMRKVLLGSMFIALIAMLAQTSTTTASTPLQTNLLKNGGFEEPYVSGGAADGWGRWHEDSNPEGNCDTETMLARPTWSKEEVGGDDGELILEGARAQHIGNNYRSWRAGVIQDVAVTAGQTYTFTFYAWGRASQDQYPAPSDNGVDFTVRAGIDPTGSGLWSNSNVVWGSTASPHQSWQQVTVTATAANSTISVLTDANFGGPGHCRKHLDIWFDKAELVGSGPAPAPTAAPTNTPNPAVPTNAPVPTNVPLPTNTPFPTRTPWPTNTPLPVGIWPTATLDPSIVVPPTNTPAPTNTPLPIGPWQTNTPVAVLLPTITPVAVQPVVIQPIVQQPIAQPISQPVQQAQPTTPPQPTAIPPTATPEPPATGSICLNAFGDANGNGLHDANEGYNAGVTFTIAQSNAVVVQGVSLGSSTPVCFENLMPGDYQVAQTVPPTLEMTTAGNVQVTVVASQAIGLEFGSRVRQVTEDNSVSNTLANANVDAGGQPVQSVSAPADAAADEGGFSILAISGLIAILLAVLLLFAVIFLILQRR